MGSVALESLLEGVAEISALQRANLSPGQGGGFTRPQVTRAIGRAEVVLLSSHFERYLYAINEEAVDHLLQGAVLAGALPVKIRLLHARSSIDELSKTQWDNRGAQLRHYSEKESDLWLDEKAVANLDPARLLQWMKTPSVESVVRFFRVWGVQDIFASITRKPLNRGRLRLRIEELVSKRNNIAHGDATVEATYLDVIQYTSAAKTFCARADRVMAKQVSGLTGGTRPW